MIIDLPGNLTDTPILGEVLAASDFAVIPVVPERAAILPTQRTAQIVADQRLPFKILCNIVEPLRGPGAGSSSCGNCSMRRASRTSGVSSGGTSRTRNPSSTACR